MRIGIIGGSFNPIHYGHLIMAELLTDSADMDRILFLPTGIAPHKKDLISAEDRYNMVKLAIEDNEKFFISDIETKKNKMAYTYDSIRKLREDFPEDEIFFVIGTDNLFTLENWNNFEKLSEIVNFLIVNRYPSSNFEKCEIAEKIKELHEKYEAKIETIENPIIEISSSFIRKRLKNNLSIRYLTPKKVEEYIENRKLYK